MSDGLRGRFVWYELLTSDPDAAIDFYTRLIGWSSALAQCSDPQGAMFAIHSVARAG